MLARSVFERDTVEMADGFFACGLPLILGLGAGVFRGAMVSFNCRSFLGGLVLVTGWRQMKIGNWRLTAMCDWEAKRQAEQERCALGVVVVGIYLLFAAGNQQRHAECGMKPLSWSGEVIVR